MFFAVGLMSDPNPLVDHVYQIFINDRLEEMKNEGHYFRSYYDDDLLKSLYTESQVQLPGHPLHNKHINFYSHRDDHFYRRQIETTPIYFPSKVYVFSYITRDILLSTEHGEQEAEMPECELIVDHNPCEAVTQSLISNCQAIMRHQAINNLYIKYIDLLEIFAFNISKHIQSVKLSVCDFTSQTLNLLMEQINECTALRKIDLSFTNLPGISSLTLRNKTSLTHLDLHSTWMSRGFSWSVCYQLSDLTQLRYLDLSGNDLSLVNMIHLSNKPNLSCLRCCDAQMPTKLSKNLMGQLRYMTHLNYLDLSHNTLTGCLFSFLSDPHPGLPELHILDLTHTTLNKDDLKHLSHITQYNLPNLQELVLSDNILTGCLPSFLPDPHPGLLKLVRLNLMFIALNQNDLLYLTDLIIKHKLPRLENLDLSENMLYKMESDVKRLIEACVTHHQRRLKLWMWRNDLSDTFKTKWKKRCAGTDIRLDFA